MKKKLLSLLTLMLCVGSTAWGETEVMKSSSGAGTCYTFTETYHRGSGSKLTYNSTDYTTTGKIKPNSNATLNGVNCTNAALISVNGGYKITGIEIVARSNYDNALDLTNLYIDNTSTDVLGGTITINGKNGDVIYKSISGFEATTGIVLQFAKNNNAELPSQVVMYMKFTYEEVTGVTADPSITQSSNTVKLACNTSGASIYYTTDGSEPSSSSSAYSSPFTLVNSCTVRAIAIKEGVSSNVVSKSCYVTHSDALAVLGYNGGTLDSDSKVWTSTDGQYILTDESWTESNHRTIQYTNLAGSQDGFKINHTDYYTLKVGEDIKVTKIVVVGKSWLAGDEGNASTIAFDGFTPSSVSFYDYLTGGETYVKTAEFTPSSELDYGATITMRPGKNQLGAYIEVFGVKRSGPEDPITGETITEVATIISGGTASSTVTPSGNASIITTSGNTTTAISKTCLKLESNSGTITIALPSSVTSASVKLLASVSSATESSIKVNNGTAFVPSWSGNTTDGYTATIDITEYAGSNVTITKGSGTVNIAQITVTYSTGVEGQVTLTTTDNMDGWRAFYDASNSYTVDENTKVYVATANSTTSVTLTELSAGIPIGTAVLLHTTSSADNHKMTLTKASVSAYKGTNLLSWTTSAVSDVYRLGYGDSGVGFYPYSGTPSSGAVILNTSSASPARALAISFSNDGVNGIDTVETGKGLLDGEYYDLQGRRVAQPTKGLYILNGKKVVMK